jgi:hypothetical protein
MKIMKEQKIVVQEATVEEVENEGLIALLGQPVILFCANFSKRDKDPTPSMNASSNLLRIWYAVSGSSLNLAFSGNCTN